MMLELARSPAPGDRDRLLLALADLCDHRGWGGPAAEGLVRDVFIALVGKVERDIRQRLSEKLAYASWAPRELVLMLARDEIEIARPMLASSPVLEDADLVRLLVESAIEHQIEIACRPQLGHEVVNAILDQALPDVLTALAGNVTAKVSHFDMSRLVAFSQTMVGLRAPLSHHPHLTPDLGAMLYVWVGETLRRSLTERYAPEAKFFQAAVIAAVHEARGAPGDGVSLDTDERAAMDRRVVEKLKVGGQLRPGLLLRALKDGKLTLFTIALAELAGLTTDEIRQALETSTPDLLALACAAAGVDRSAAPSIISLVRGLNNDLPGGGALQGSASLLDAASAARVFRKRLSEV